MKQSFRDKEIEKFNDISSDWWLGNKSFDLLHQINPIRINYIRKSIFTYQGLLKFNQLQILDIGCGGGLVSIPLAKIGAQVTALDGGINNIEIAEDKAKEFDLNNIEFICKPIELYEEKGKKYDVVICLEMIEHVADQVMLLEKLSYFLKPNGLLIISTLNKTYLSWFLSIYMAENVLNLLPKNTHDYNNFIIPEEITRLLNKYNLMVKESRGINWNPAQGWHVSNQVVANYILTAQKVV